MKVKVCIVFMICMVCMVTSSRSSSIGETGAQFLKIGVGVKACAMGEAFTSVADDPTAIYWNPAGLSQINSIELLGMQNFWLVDMSYQYLAGVFPTSSGNFGVSVAHSSSGDIPKYENFIKVGDYTAYDAAGAFAYARRIGDIFSVGVGFKYIHMKIEEESAAGWALDAGFLFVPAAIKGLQMGLSILNMGPGIKFIEKEDPLPFNPRFGVSYRIGPVLLASDVNKYRDNELKFNLGAAYNIKDILELYGGYNTYDENESVSGGVSIFIRSMGFGYAFVSYRDLDNSHRISTFFRL